LAVSWVDFLLSDKGIDIMKRMGMNPVIPAITNDASKVPAPLVRYL
jgi:ABC-type Fe3+ transport system substrate-binding protein